MFAFTALWCLSAILTTVFGIKYNIVLLGIAVELFCVSFHCSSPLLLSLTRPFLSYLHFSPLLSPLIASLLPTSYLASLPPPSNINVNTGLCLHQWWCIHRSRRILYLGVERRAPDHLYFLITQLSMLFEEV